MRLLILVVITAASLSLLWKALLNDIPAKITSTKEGLHSSSNENNNDYDDYTVPFDVAQQLHFSTMNTISSSKDNVTRNFVSAALGSNMVIQRDQEAILWGYSKEPKATITTRLYKQQENDNGDAYNNLPYLQLLTTADDDGLWKQTLVPHPASMEPQSITITSSTGESKTLDNVLFGDVYICGGQSNMEFSIPGTTNATEEAKRANNYPHVRLFTVGKGTPGTDDFLMPDLQTVKQPWSVANSLSIAGQGDFSHFSSVCWFFGREISEGLNNSVPIGLISNNWGGTAVELWKPGGHLYNAMIHPYMIGPMALTGFTWYQGEANAGNPEPYGHLFSEMIEQWRSGFNATSAYFGFVQLSTWCPKTPERVAQMRQSQMAALQLKSGNVGYATNADHGAGCNIHPPAKQYCGTRLAKSALALQYGQTSIHWKSPSYYRYKESSITTTSSSTPMGQSRPYVVIEMQDVTDKGLYILGNPYNNRLDPKDFRCEDQVPGTCAGAEVLLNGKGWVNATLSVQGKNHVVLTAEEGDASDTIVATSYGWGSVPMLSLYDKGTDLPALPWRGRL